MDEAGQRQRSFGKLRMTNGEVLPLTLTRLRRTAGCGGQALSPQEGEGTRGKVWATTRGRVGLHPGWVRSPDGLCKRVFLRNEPNFIKAGVEN